MTAPAPEICPGARVLVTGATGFTGSALMRKLAGAGVDLHAIARASSDLKPLADLNITWHRGDVFDPAVVERATRGVEYIFHMATTYREGGSSSGLFHKVHVTSTQLLAEAAREQPGFKRFVHVSTIGVHGHIKDPPANEESPFAPGDAYQETKLAAELWLREYAQEHGLDVTVIRPAGIYGPGDKRLFKVFKMASRPVFPLLGRGKCLYHLVHVDDLTKALMLAATHPAARQNVFICGADAPIPMAEMGRVIADELGHSLRVMRLPAWPAFLLAAMCEAVCRPLGVRPPLFRRRVAFFTKDRAFDTKKLRNTLGYACGYTNESGLRETARWYRDNGWLSATGRGGRA